jgi:glycosyltransferase involved in cell wall biosynthesis
VVFPAGKSDAESSAALAAALLELLRAPERARTLGDAGRKAVMQDFSMTRLATRLVELTATFAKP